jgi:hypothetical protein
LNELEQIPNRLHSGKQRGIIFEFQVDVNVCLKSRAAELMNSGSLADLASASDNKGFTSFLVFPLNE